jgi:hypothetical protein
MKYLLALLVAVVVSATPTFSSPTAKPEKTATCCDCPPNPLCPDVPPCCEE